MIKIGEKIPDFTLGYFQSDNGTETDKDAKLTLSKYRGTWMVLVFYPADFTFVCPTELEELAGLHSAFKKAGAEVMSVSTDTVFVHKAWHDASPAIKKITYPMIADPTGNLCRAFGTYIDDEGLSLRGSFIIDPDGALQAYEINANNIGRSGEELLRKLTAAIYVREHKNEACPAKWKPGEKTLRPGMDLVGKI